MNEFSLRGVVEGFYGPSYEEDDRMAVIEAIGRRGMNAYLYAPKDDPLQREHWREPYPESNLERFARWIERGEAVGVRVGFAVSPGLSIRYAVEDDVATLCSKFARFHEIGCRFFSLQLDDVPSTLQHAEDRVAFESLASAHVALAHAVAETVGEESALWLVPTDYAGTGHSPYLETLGSELDSRIEVAWTGRTVVSPTIRVEEARERAELLKRRIVVWDNYPVTDGAMRPMLHLGPYVGRPPQLIEHVSGVLLNPMEHPRASLPALLTAADYLTDPAGYVAEGSLTRAIEQVGAGAPEALTLFAAAHCVSPLAPDERDRELEDGFHAFRDADDANRPERLDELDRLLALREAVPKALRDRLADRALLAEIEPWLESFSTECLRMRIAVDFHRALGDAESAMERFLAFSRFEGRLTHLITGKHTSFGPRRVLYPQLRNHEDDRARFGDDPSLFIDHCLADAFVKHAEATGAQALGAVRLEVPQ
ncbi:MAG: beta-N-acetylglucosaminidase domain-containing protein [Myxococcota bacterium]|jgi:hyaluronoglucosaminidase|nr:beta-N-acetylglucosaminidase domain-containing protein [Myxococcota bacterium]